MKQINMKSPKIILTVLMSILALDILTKYLAQTFLQKIYSYAIFNNFFHLTYVENRGAAFGFLAETNAKFRTPFFIVVSLLAIICISVFYKKTEGTSSWYHFGLLLILAGAIGNLIDRIRFGYVIDFFDFHWYQYHWPAFNIADAVICIGVGIVFLDMLIISKESPDCTPYSLK